MHRDRQAKRGKAVGWWTSRQVHKYAGINADLQKKTKQSLATFRLIVSIPLAWYAVQSTVKVKLEHSK
jgi:hypothetical protein